MKLHVFPPSPRAFKVTAVAHHLGLDVELQLVDLLKQEHLTPAFLALNPNGKMPVLEDAGFVLWESNAIMQYLAAKKPHAGLWPSDARQQADVSRWQCWDLAHWDTACATLAFERFVKQLTGQGDPDRAKIAAAEESFHKLARVLETHLRRRDWLVGNALTLADVSVGAWLTAAQLGSYPLDGYTEIARWYRGLEALPAWQKAAAPLSAAA